MRRMLGGSTDEEGGAEGKGAREGGVGVGEAAKGGEGEGGEMILTDVRWTRLSRVGRGRVVCLQDTGRAASAGHGLECVRRRRGWRA